MNAQEVIEKCSELEAYQQRRVSENYSEVVFFNKEIFKWMEVLNGILGDPVSPAGIKPTEEDVNLTQDFGGISDSQTLYKKAFDRHILLAMFWPWQDGEHITLKIIVVNKNE